MKIFEKYVNINKMKRLGVITIAQDRIDRDDARIMLKDDKSLNQAFFERMQQCTYKANKEDCILSSMDSGNLILAHFDNDVIFLLSQDSVLSPKEFIEAMANLMNCSNEMNSLLERKSWNSYSSFDMNSLNINFAQMEFATEMPENINEHYILAKRGEKGYNDNIGLKYSSERGTFTYSHMSNYGTSLLGFIDEMIRTNPDIRLLMSNVVCIRKGPEIAQAMADTIGHHCMIGHFGRGEFLPRDVFENALANFKNLVKDEKFLRTFEEEKRYRIHERERNNKKYEIYEALKTVIKSGDLDNMFQLEWHDGDSDCGIRAIFSSLNKINREKMMGRDGANPRGILEVKTYMGDVTAKARQLSIEDRQREIKTQKLK